MIEEIVDRIASATSVRAVRYGGRDLPTAPYAVVKTEKLPAGRGIRVILHYDLDEQCALEEKMREIIKALENQGFTDAAGNYNRLGRMIDYTDVGPVSDDQTITMEALFLMPTTIF